MSSSVVIVRLLVWAILVALISVRVMAEAPNRHNVDFAEEV